MTTRSIPALMLLCLIVTAVQWWQIRKATRKEIIAYFSLTGLVWVVAIALFVNPRLPGPTDWINAVFTPIGSFMPK